MSKVVCSNCKLEGDSKCPFCRNVFADKNPLGSLDEISSYRLKIKDEGILIGIFPDRDDAGRLTGKTEDHGTILAMLVNSVNRVVASGVAVEEVCKTLCCVHTWGFAPGATSEIGCGHGKKKENK